MSTSNNEVLNFVELLEKHKVEIPIIQRDYVQGMHHNILDNFLSALKKSIVENKDIKLDFIYGESDTNTDIFQPLDGQQRLTTLFLLYWYALRKENKATNLLERFSYEIRFTSRDFCEELVKSKIKIPNDDKEIISDLIIDTSWFHLFWKKDPTIKAMLNSLDRIHTYFYNVDGLYDKITKNISFYYLNLENIGLTDDLYIKMNARGKQLTSFENFKAGLEKKIKDGDWESTIDAIDKKFSFLIDTKWTDFFWEHFKKDNNIDLPHMRFITTIVMTQIPFMDKELEKKLNTRELIKIINNKYEYIAPEHITEDIYKYIYKCYDLYASDKYDENKLKLDFPFWQHQGTGSFLKDIVTDSSSYTAKVLFYAQTEYLLNNTNFDKDKYYEWMRVIRNIVSHGDADYSGNRPTVIRDEDSFNSVIVLINELKNGCDDIYKYLTDNEIKNNYAKKQVEREILKSKIFNLKPNFKKLIWKTEDINLLRGNISFPLYCIDFDENNIENLNETLLCAINEVLAQHFDKEELSDDIRRAMLTVEVDGKYDFYEYWWSWWYAGKAHKRKLFNNYRELEYFIYQENYKEYFKKLVLKLTKEDAYKITDNFNPPENMPEWKIKLIKEKKWMEKFSTKYIAIANDNKICYRLKSQRPADTDGSPLIQ